MSKPGFCDYRCWAARGSVCRCHCGGVFHGVLNTAPMHKIEGVLGRLLEDPAVQKYGFTEQHLDMVLQAMAREEEGAVTEAIKTVSDQVKKMYKVA